ncbi:cytochrome C [Bacillus sp. B15-48]|uniref:c-type cytochrome n=1 Tax=Bacillus sp. B15-48 TaxID=1548601 RepID=UPI00193FB926|nr:cytochrome C [Bacillus sp. B15-48]MBM4761795.1 cytochrome C [Bacillus sp. B15-48]
MRNVIVFFITLLIGFGLGYLFFTAGDDRTTEETESTERQTPAEEGENHAAEDLLPPTSEEEIGEGSQILNEKSCISCHSVSALNLQGGATGPDLSNSYLNVEGKHGKPLDEYLQQPTSAVMTSVIEGNPLSDEERAQIIEALRIAAEQN